MTAVWTGLLGAAAGAAIWIALAALAPAPPSLAAGLALLAPDTGTVPVEEPGGVRRLAERLGLPRPQVRADLRALDRTVEDYAARLGRLMLLAAAAPVAAGLLLAVAGTGLDPALVAAAAVGFAILAWALVDADLHAEAERERAEALRVLAAVLSLTAMALAGGAGIDSALRTATANGAGRAFDRIRAALDRAGLLMQTPWDALAEVGDRLGAAAYTQLASTTALAGTEGARIRQSLTDRATALRTARQAATEADEHSRSERMSIWLVLIAASFIVLLGFPAFDRIMTGL
ncbi:type II secretion system F family protein [Glycomyces sp. MUSA5-2]|uniref:type II secretion system F family protein n=1 Tax=Glycomyces sp. MUSA5-2 TaxID=2053002 RepID=UPI00300A2FC4